MKTFGALMFAGGCFLCPRLPVAGSILIVLGILLII